MTAPHDQPSQTKESNAEQAAILALRTKITDYQPQWSAWVRQFATVGLVIGAIYALTLLAPVIQILVAAFLLAFVMFAPARFLARRTRLHFSGAVVVIYLLMIIAFIWFLIVFVPAFVSGTQNLLHDVERAYGDVRTTLTNYKPGDAVVNVLNQTVDFDPLVQQVRELLVGTGFSASVSGAVKAPLDLAPAISTVTGTITGVIAGIASFVTTVLLALFISFLILLELPSYQRILFKSVPEVYHRELALLIAKIGGVWSSFFRGQVTIGIIIGIVTWVQLTLMGVPAATTLAIFTAFVSLIPTVGGIIAAVPLGLVPLLQGSTVFVSMSHGTFALLVVVINIVISQVIWNGVAPNILGNALALPLPVIIVGVVIGAALGGAVGAFLIVPILGTLRVIVIYLMMKIVQHDPFPDQDSPHLTDLGTL